MKVEHQSFVVNSKLPETKYYTTLQYQEFVDEDECSRVSKDSDKVFAKSIPERLPKDNGSKIPQTKYYVRGTNGKNLFVPFPKYSVSDNKSSFVDKVCKGDQRFLEVTKSVFDKYINFLKTENRQYFNAAQKEIM